MGKDKFCMDCGARNSADAAVCSNCNAYLNGADNVSGTKAPTQLDLVGRLVDFGDGRGTFKVKVVDIDMPFWSMVIFMVNWSLASIPAFLILLMTAFLFMAVFTGQF